MADWPKHKSHRDQEPVGQKSGHVCPNVFKSQQRSIGILKNQIQGARHKRKCFDIPPTKLNEELDAIIRNARMKLAYASGTSNIMRHTSTHCHRQYTDAERCSVESRWEPTLCNTRRATPSDEKRQANRSARVSKVFFFFFTIVDIIRLRIALQFEDCICGIITIWGAVQCRSAKSGTSSTNDQHGMHQKIK